jgi:hypothetical protein
VYRPARFSFEQPQIVFGSYNLTRNFPALAINFRVVFQFIVTTFSPFAAD